MQGAPHCPTQNGIEIPQICFHRFIFRFDKNWFEGEHTKSEVKCQDFVFVFSKPSDADRTIHEEFGNPNLGLFKVFPGFVKLNEGWNFCQPSLAFCAKVAVRLDPSIAQSSASFLSNDGKSLNNLELWTSQQIVELRDAMVQKKLAVGSQITPTAASW